MDGNINIIRLIIFVICVIISTVIYYKKIISVKPGESKRIEMLKFLFIILIIVGLLNALTLTDDEDYKSFILVIVICFINIYNARYIFKYCPAIEPQFKITLYVRMSIVIILIALLLRYTNRYGLFSFLYEDKSSDKTDDKGRITRAATKLKMTLDENMPPYCPDMSDDDYTTEGTSDNRIWIGLATPSRTMCTDKREELYRRVEVETDVYK